jgi:hypothetical protein
MSATRKHRVARQVERIKAVFDEYPGGVSRARLAFLADIPEASVSRLMVILRRNATEIGKLPVALQIGGEWTYGWAHLLREHRTEHHKRRKAEKRSLALSIEMLEQSVNEQPKAADLKRQLTAANARLEWVEMEIEELSGQLRLIRQTEAA